MDDSLGLIHLVLDRLILLTGADVLQQKPMDLIVNGIRDPIYVFIKDEPHKREKLEKGRFRLISCVSLVDTLIERLLFSQQNQNEIALCDDLCYKPGMGLHDDGLKALYKWFQKVQEIFPICSTDVSAWDWSVPGWLLKLETCYRVAFEADRSRKLLVVNYGHGLRNKVFNDSLGQLYEQMVEGIQPSGCYTTSSGNSHMRYMLASLVQLRCGVDEWCEYDGGQMGDDALERYMQGMLEVYVGLGFTVKGVSVQPRDHFDFCSTQWRNSWAGSPESFPKTLFRFLFKRKSDPLYLQFREQLARDLRHLAGKEEILTRVDAFHSLVVEEKSSGNKIIYNQSATAMAANNVTNAELRRRLAQSQRDRALTRGTPATRGRQGQGRGGVGAAAGSRQIVSVPSGRVAQNIPRQVAQYPNARPAIANPLVNGVNEVFQDSWRELDSVRVQLAVCPAYDTSLTQHPTGAAWKTFLNGRDFRVLYVQLELEGLMGNEATNVALATASFYRNVADNMPAGNAILRYEGSKELKWAVGARQTWLFKPRPGDRVDSNQTGDPLAFILSAGISANGVGVVAPTITKPFAYRFTIGAVVRRPSGLL